MIIEKRTDDEDVTVVVHFQERLAMLGNFEIKVGELRVNEKGSHIVKGEGDFIGLLGNLENGPPINVIISKEVFGYMKEVFADERT